MKTDDETTRALRDQAGTRIDDAPERFRAGSNSERFTGSSGLLFEQAMAQTHMAVTLVDPHAEDQPIVFANREFCRLTGYSEEEVIGRNCRFLQGPKTDSAPKARMREAINNEEVAVCELINYRKDGTTFWNALHLGPIYNDKGELIYYFGSQWDVSDVRASRAEEQYAKEMARELSHRMKNMFAVISGIVNVTGRSRGIQSGAAEINSRIQALGRAYETTLDDASSGSIDIDQAIRAVLSPFNRSADRLEMNGDAARMPFTVISVVGLVLHEMCVNATKHGAWSADGGKVTVDWRMNTDESALIVNWIEKDGPPVDVDAYDAGTGTAIVDRLLATARGSVTRNWAEDGLNVTISIPSRGTT